MLVMDEHHMRRGSMLVGIGYMVDDLCKSFEEDANIQVVSNIKELHPVFEEVEHNLTLRFHPPYVQGSETRVLKAWRDKFNLHTCLKTAWDPPSSAKFVMSSHSKLQLKLKFILDYDKRQAQKEHTMTKDEMELQDQYTDLLFHTLKQTLGGNFQQVLHEIELDSHEPRRTKTYKCWWGDDNYHHVKRRAQMWRVGLDFDHCVRVKVKRSNCTGYGKIIIDFGGISIID